MVISAVQEQLLTDLEQLSPEEQKHAAQLVHGLVSALPLGTPGASLLRFSGAIDPQSIREMKEAIEESWERVSSE